MIFRKKKKPKYKSITSVTQIKSHLREFIMDSQIPNADDVSVKLGCPPISDEVYDKELEQSDLRAEKISFLIPLLYGYSALFAEAFVTNMSAENASEKVPPELKKLIDQITEQTKVVLEDAMAHLLIGSVSQLVDLGLINVARKEK